MPRVAAASPRPAPFGPELPLAFGYHFVCPKGHEARPKVRAFREWLFAEMAETKEKWAAMDGRSRELAALYRIVISRAARRRAISSSSSRRGS